METMTKTNLSVTLVDGLWKNYRSHFRKISPVWADGRAVNQGPGLRGMQGWAELCKPLGDVQEKGSSEVQKGGCQKGG